MKFVKWIIGFLLVIAGLVAALPIIGTVSNEVDGSISSFTNCEVTGSSTFLDATAVAGIAALERKPGFPPPKHPSDGLHLKRGQVTDFVISGAAKGINNSEVLTLGANLTCGSTAVAAAAGTNVGLTASVPTEISQSRYGALITWIGDNGLLGIAVILGLIASVGAGLGIFGMLSGKKRNGR